MSTSTIVRGLALAIAVGAAACGPVSGGNNHCDGGTCPGGGDGGGTGTADAAPHVLLRYAVDPPNPVVFIDNMVPATQAFTVTAIYADNVNDDVTAMATWQVATPSLGSMAGNVFTTNTTGGFTEVIATVGSKTGSAIITMVPRRIDPMGNPLDFFFIAPYQAATTPDSAILTFGTTIQEGDVGFIMDVSGSQGSKIANLNSALSSLASSLKMVIPSVALGVAEFSSWPCGSDGSSGDYPWKLDNRIVTVSTAAGLTQIQNSVNSLMAGGSHIGGDGPEDAFDAAWFAATGTGEGDCGGGSVAAFNDATAPGGVAGETTGMIGGFGFRTGAMPIIVIITDAEFQDIEDPGDTAFISGGPGALAHGHTATAAAINAIGGKVIGVASRGGSGPPPFDGWSPIFTGSAIPDATGSEPHAQEQWLAEQTGTFVPVGAYGGACGAGLCCTGLSGAGEAPDASGNCPLVYQVDASGSGLGTTLADAIHTLVTEGLLSVGTGIVGKTTDESMPPIPLQAPNTTAQFLAPVDAMRGVVPLDSNPAVGSPGGPTAIDAATGRFLNVRPGTQVRFTVRAFNDFVMPTGQPQFFKANIQVLGNGATLLDQRDVYILVPPTVVIN